MPHRSDEVLWTVSMGTHYWMATVRTVVGVGLQLRFIYDGNLHSSQIHRDRRALDVAAETRREKLLASGWIGESQTGSTMKCPICDCDLVDVKEMTLATVHSLPDGQVERTSCVVRQGQCRRCNVTLSTGAETDGRWYWDPTCGECGRPMPYAGPTPDSGLRFVCGEHGTEFVYRSGILDDR